MELHLPELALPADLVAQWPSSSFGGRRGRPSIPQPLPVTEIVRASCGSCTAMPQSTMRVHDPHWLCACRACVLTSWTQGDGVTHSWSQSALLWL